MPRGRSLLLAAGIVPIAVVAVALWLGVGRGAGPTCELEAFPEQGSRHLESLPRGFEYNSFPPTSGPSDDRPLVWETYSEPVSQFRLVHGLLHGGIGVQYGDRVPAQAVAAVREWYESDPEGIVLAPLPDLGEQVVLTAWRNRATCDSFSEREFTSFRSRHRFGGPERPTRGSMRRGDDGETNALGLRVTPPFVRDRATVTLGFDEPLSVSVEIRRERASGPLVRRLQAVSLLPGRAVRLRWDVTDDAGRRLPPGTYAAVARVRGWDDTPAAHFEVATPD